MKSVWGLILFLSLATGCATTGTVQTNQRSHGSWSGAPSSSASFPSQELNTGPRLILPASGGPPVLALPLGGGVYLPLTADPPVVGIPLAP
jgi:hypothetical protein